MLDEGSIIQIFNKRVEHFFPFFYLLVRVVFLDGAFFSDDEKENAI